MTERQARCRFTEEFGVQAVQYLVDSGKPSSEVAAELGVGVDQLNAWAVERLIPAHKSLAAQAAKAIDEIQRLEREAIQLKAEVAKGRLRSARALTLIAQMSLMLCWLASKVTSAPKRAKPEATATVRTVSEEYSGPYAAPEGASPFEVALDAATPEHLGRVRAVTGEIGPDRCVQFWRSTDNPVWLLIAAGGVGQPSEIPAEAFAFLRSAGQRIVREVVAQLRATDRVRVKPGEEMPDVVEAVAPGRGRPRAARPPPDLMALLGLSSPKRNLVQAVAANVRDASFAVAREDQARRTGESREQIDHDLAQAFGMKAGDEVSEYAALGRAVKGRKLLARPGRRGRPPKGSATPHFDK